MQVITEQTCTEHLRLLRSQENGQPVCHYILVPYDKISIIKRYEKGEKISITNCYRIIEYRDEKGKVRRASTYGQNPSEKLSNWINKQYGRIDKYIFSNELSLIAIIGPAAIDKYTTLVYVEDDIRLCTMQRSNLDHLIGLSYQFHNFEHFYYIESLKDESNSKLAFCAGVKCFDRVIEFNGVNIEGDSEDELLNRIDKSNVLTIQLLVCSPATYAHYKSKNKHIHSNLETVKVMRPVNDKLTTSLAGSEQIRSDEYCAVRWEDDSGVSTVKQSAVRKPPNSIRLFEQRMVERGTNYRNGQIILIGSKSDCEILRYTNTSSNREEDTKKISDTNSRTQHATSKVKSNKQETKQNENIHRVRCDGCQSRYIQDDCYRCLQCLDFDLCGECFEKRSENAEHRSGHMYVHLKTPKELFGKSITNLNDEVNLTKIKKYFTSVEHTDIFCNGCSMEPIVGIRFKCDTCPCYDLCLKCVEEKIITLQHESTHPLIVVDQNCLPEIDMNDLKLDDVLGQGAFGTVYKSRWLSKNRQVACKILNVPPDRLDLYESFLRELGAYNELSGAYILKLYGYAHELPKYNGGVHKCALIMEYMGQGSLKNVIQNKKLSLHQKLDMAWHVANGMRKLHARNMIHRDIRPDNILVNDVYTAKIGDMGIARSMTTTGDENLTMIGCQSYMPPEFYTGIYNQSLDVYTFGLTLYYIFTETGHQFDLLFRKISLSQESPVFNDLIVRCINDRPKRRPSAVEIEATLNLYRRTFNKFISTEHPKYEQYSIDRMNQIFMNSYNKLRLRLQEEVTKELSTRSSNTDDESDNEHTPRNFVVLLQWLIQSTEQT
ncbi:unnamed protein product [Rotaria sordida]|uniref:Uncharacterized protein n=1 Tax=Rotaria sordida TaxID=392033 RepID=A0A818SE80_9BILA|nr:unnamed protein product [Rotaria sordida]